ncbi:MAG TPA: hypothetical protein DD490_24490 [Acidobacteria bacterium]|nr:hypothetical protein [Acidobacteriota bacterium]
MPQAAERARPPFAVDDAERMARGSNNWAVAGAHTADGRALLANDMHLGLGVPNTWYRAALVRPDGAGGTTRITGVSLPGAPVIVVGSNGHVAWGFTNSYGDWSDLILLEIDPRDSEAYRTPDGWRRFERTEEVIEVKGGEPVRLPVRTTIWGPVLDQDHRGRLRALAWTAHHPEAVNLTLMEMDGARTLEDALAVAWRSGAPAQNFVAADAAGRIGWTILGQMPRRVGFDGRVPTSWADGTHRWDGWLSPGEVPRVVDPPAGRVWTANTRVVEGDLLAKVGDGGYFLGARARQIRDGLLALDKATPRDLLAVQLDDRALFLAPWHQLLLRTLTPEAVAADPRRRELRHLLETTWTGHASIDSVAFRFVRAWHDRVVEQVLTPITARCEKADARFVPDRGQAEGPAWELLRTRPPHLLDPAYASWDEALLAEVDALLDRMARDTPGPLADRTWGERNTTRSRHPLSGAIPFLGRWIDMPPRPLPGDADLPRFQRAAFGASERLVVSPGREDEGIFHMPGGQSGHPLSPYYRIGHTAWEEGRPTPFLPGPVEHTLRLVP